MVRKIAEFMRNNIFAVNSHNCTFENVMGKCKYIKRKEESEIEQERCLFVKQTGTMRAISILKIL